tara:strand:+ start:45623 stop:46303 length:681 start_codon:yes stop_codon:yes gene_type:complete
MENLKNNYTNTQTLDWKISDQPIEYNNAIDFMESKVKSISSKQTREMVWLLEHPHLYTAGTSARSEDLIQPDKFPVFKTSRGGKYTYHGPGQRIAYVMLDLASRKKGKSPDLHEFITNIENWLIATLSHFGISGEKRNGSIGIWVKNKSGQDAKIAAIGIRVRHWVTFHGVSINVDPDLDNFEGIIPCGIRGSNVTSLSELGIKATLQDVDKALQREFDYHFPSHT